MKAHSYTAQQREQQAELLEALAKDCDDIGLGISAGVCRRAADMLRAGPNSEEYEALKRDAQCWRNYQDDLNRIQQKKEELPAAYLDALARGDRIAAIRELRGHAGTSLRAAMDHVDKQLRLRAATAREECAGQMECTGKYYRATDCGCGAKANYDGEWP